VRDGGVGGGIPAAVRLETMLQILWVKFTCFSMANYVVKQFLLLICELILLCELICEAIFAGIY